MVGIAKAISSRALWVCVCQELKAVYTCFSSLGLAMLKKNPTIVIPENFRIRLSKSETVLQTSQIYLLNFYNCCC